MPIISVIYIAIYLVIDRIDIKEEDLSKFIETEGNNENCKEFFVFIHNV